MKNRKEELIKVYQKLIGDGVASDKNLFEMASLKEFRHSAILGYLLSRQEHGRFVHVESLVKRIVPDAVSWSFDGTKVQCEFSVKTNNSKRPIDIFCQFGGKALIIENKCNGASDQDMQIVDYWNGVKKLGYKDKDIYVLYLPPISNLKGPSECSVGDLKFDGELKGHLIVLSYRDLILPWLKEDVLQQVCYGNGRLVDSLRSYIDLLEGAYGERSQQYDDRAVLTNKFIKCTEGQKDNGKNLESLWKKTDEILTQIYDFQVEERKGRLKQIDSSRTEDEKSESAEISEEDSRKIVELDAAIRRIRTFLLEQNPLLDGNNLIYEVYWMLRNKPTLFGAKHMKERLDSGRFFVNGQKGSIWDSKIVKDKDSEHTVEVVCNSRELIEYLRGNPIGTIINLGIGGLSGSSELLEKLKEKYHDRVQCLDNGWTKILIDNTAVGDVSKKAGGDLLYELAKRIAEQAKAFSEILADAFGDCE